MRRSILILYFVALAIFQIEVIKDLENINCLKNELNLLDLGAYLNGDLADIKVKNDGDQNYTICKNKLRGLIMNNTDDPLFRPFASYSGLGINHFGNYDLCRKSKNLTFFLFNVIPPNPDSVVKFGACIPKECTNVTLYLTIQNAIRTTIPFLKKFHLPLSIIDSQEENEKLNKLSFGFFACIIILFMYILLVVISTVRKYFLILNSNPKSDKNKNYINPIKPSKGLVILDCFNLKDNVESIMKTENRIDSKLNSLQFLRCIGIYWVVMGHYFSIEVFVETSNMLKAVNDVMKETGMAFLRNATISVDIFFILGGFLSTMGLVSVFENVKNRNLKNLLLTYFHRYARLFPMMIIAWVITSFLLPFMVDGVNTYRIDYRQDLCKTRFLQTFLYIDNYLTNTNYFCNGYIWYLYIDMQLFIITPFIVYPALKNINLGLISLLGLTIISLVIQTCIFQTNNFHADSMTSQNANFMEKYYQQTYTRCNTYFLGIFFAYLYFESTGKKLFKSSFLHCINYLFTNRILRYLLILAGVGIMLFIIFAQNWFDHAVIPIPQYKNTLFLLFSRLIFTCGTMIIMHSILKGFSRPLNILLGNSFFNILGKITYGTYMIHLLIVYYINAILKNGFTYEYYHMLVDTIGLYFLAYCCSFIITVFFESPVVQLLKLLSQSQRKNPDKKEAPREISKLMNKEFKDLESKKSDN